MKYIFIPLDIYIDYKNGIFKKKIFSRISDLVRIPVLTIALMATYLFGITFGIVYPDILYKMREVAGKLELQMYKAESFYEIRMDKDGRFAGSVLRPISKCFTPVIRLDHLHYMEDKEEDIIRVSEKLLSALKKRSVGNKLFGYETIQEKPSSIYISKAIKGFNESTSPKWKSMCQSESNNTPLSDEQKQKIYQEMQKDGVHTKSVARSYHITVGDCDAAADAGRTLIRKNRWAARRQIKYSKQVNFRLFSKQLIRL